MSDVTRKRCVVCAKKSSDNSPSTTTKPSTALPVCGVQVDGTGLDLSPGTVVFIQRSNDETEADNDPLFLGRGMPTSSMLLRVHEQPCHTSASPCLTLNAERACGGGFSLCADATAVLPVLFDLRVLPIPVPDDYVLNRVLLECANSESWSERSRIGSLCNEVVCQGTTMLLAHPGHPDIVLYTLACEPYLQGVVGAHTSVVVLPPRHRKRNINNNEKKKKATTAAVVSKESDAFVVEVLPENMPFMGLDDRSIVAVSVDAMHSLGVKQGSWVSLSGKRPHIAQVYSLPQSADSEPDVAYVHPFLLFNSGLSAGQRVRISSAALSSSSSSTSQPDPPVAREVHLARVLSPASSGTENYGYELWQYFRVRRAVTVGDVIAVKARSFASPLTQGLFESADVCDDYSSPSSPPCQSKASPHVLVYFAVTKVVAHDSDGNNAVDTHLPCLVDRDSTKLVQTGTVNHFMPPNSNAFILNKFTPTCNKNKTKQKNGNHSHMSFLLFCFVFNA